MDPSGASFRGADAVFRLFQRTPGLTFFGPIGLLPGIRQVARVAYRFITRHRKAAARVDVLLFGDRRAVPGTMLVRWLFLRGLGLVCFAAFHSLGRQVLGLYGRRGIEPLAPTLSLIEARLGRRAWRRFPSVFWIDASDERMLHVIQAGKTASTALLLNFAPRLSLAVVWASYLSFVSVGGEFLSLQWDALLLETTAAALVAAPGGLTPGLGRARTHWSAAWLFRWLAFRLHFESGLSKLLSGDRTWRTATACCHYYETAPLPTTLGWRAHQLPRWLNRTSTGLALALETVTPWLALMPRRLRRWAFVQLMFLQTMILATANYGFFNALSMIDLLWLLDDEDLWPSWARRQHAAQVSWPRRVFTGFVSGAAIALSAQMLLARMGGRLPGPRTQHVLRHIAPLEVINQYGLFSVMTTARPEIIIEGSDDGHAWRAYELRYKPGDVQRAPAFIVPHLPRLDWLLWFAAMEPPPEWFLRLLIRLLEASPDVLALFGSDPFQGRAPRFVRASLYRYSMSDRKTRRETGAWWQRARLGTYVPPLALRREGIKQGEQCGFS